MSIQALRERLAASNKAARNLLENKGSTPWSKEDQVAFDNHMDESSRTESQILATEKLNAKDREENFKDVEQLDKSKKGAEKFAGLNLFYRKKQADMSAEELDALIEKNSQHEHIEVTLDE